MADVKWIKMATNLFDNRKIRQIESLPDGDAIIVIWMKLLCLAGNINDSGLVYFTKEIPYTEEMLATEFNRPLKTVQLALKTFEQFKMVEVVENILHVSNWEKYQSVDKLNEIREYNRLAKQRSREKQKLLMESNTCQYCGGSATGYDHIIARSKGGSDEDCNKVSCCARCNKIKSTNPVVDFLNFNLDIINTDIVKNNKKLSKFVRYDGKWFRDVNDSQLTCQPCHDTDIDKDKDKERDKERIQYTQITDLYHSLCPSYPKIKALSDARKKAIKARLNTYTVDDFKTLFEKAEASTFLKGGNNNNWSANFDWLIKDANMAKVLDGNYDNRQKSAQGISNQQPLNKTAQQLDDFYNMAAQWAEGGE